MSVRLPSWDRPSASQLEATRLITKVSPPHRHVTGRQPWEARGSPGGVLPPLPPPLTPRVESNAGEEVSGREARTRPRERLPLSKQL